jgi:hypothetical protein
MDNFQIEAGRKLDEIAKAYGMKDVREAYRRAMKEHPELAKAYSTGQSATPETGGRASHEKSYSVQRDSGDRLDKATKDVMKRDGVDFATALKTAGRELPQLFSAYHTGIRTAKNFDALNASDQAMLRLQNDAEYTQELAGAILHDRAMSIAAGPMSSSGIAQATPESLTAAMKTLMAKFPDLGTAYNTGFIAADNWSLLATLVPGVSSEVKRIHGVDPYNLRSGNYNAINNARRYDNLGNEFRTYVR